ncbi:hypothetical protein [Dipodfec virus UOA04_Rod_753]|nr:hypothetical protein [Dipodfec virus UOA04_Rod_753]
MKKRVVRLKLSEFDALYFRTSGFAFPQIDSDKKLIEYYRSIGKIKD